MFATFNPSATPHQNGAAAGKLKKGGRPPRENLSAQEIRERVAKGLGKDISDKTKLSNSGKKWGNSFMDNGTEGTKANAENGEAAQASDKPVGDINSNDPNDAVTQEKLRDLVAKGGFNFSEKEKQVLAGILNQ